MLSRRQRSGAAIALYVFGWLLIIGGLVLATFLGDERVNAWAFILLALLDVALVVAGLAFLHGGVNIRKGLKRGTYCPKCEYDMRESEGRCPECGWTAAS